MPMEVPSHKQRVSISTGTIVRFFLVGISIFLLYYMFGVLMVIVTALVIASAIEPLVRRFVHHGINRIVGVVIIYVVLAAITAGVFIFFMPLLVKDTVSFLDTIPRTISLDTLWSPIREVSVNVGETSIASRSISISDFINGLQSLIVGTGAGAFQTASFFFGGVLSFILIVVLSFYLAVQKEGVENFLRIITPVRRHDYVVDLWKRSQRKIGFWLQGQVVLGLIVGVLVFISLLFVGIPHALLLAILAAALEIIPVFGPILAAVPAVLIGYESGGAGTAALLVGLYLIIHQLENHLFYPLVVKKIVGISPIVVIISLIIGGKLAGVMGAVLAVPMAAALMEYIHDIEKNKRAEKDLLV